ncbi:LOW QUALITY PROTEIN: hypothetical protein Smp_163040 [Schistosoma mansoni]|uniref:hypothetical protein n=1 Tax=Schistosoma mansoni TaxID=6183 RepID=UPI00022C87B1|nr:LOW QUALITY PROTEIN: hypothetical protein Smp_163040 [Schistosoma mansoni]|eukprot:XP_018645529.1 LOW QUALITY PROTEIN: hypothetical protein Smp_163040 [Schistosoma mansoni]
MAELLKKLSLKSLGKNERDYEIVKNANNSAVTLPEFPHKVVLSEDVIQESLFISEVFNFNELRAVELCLTVESQLSLFPCLGRGFVAVVLYYESHLSIIDTLVALIGARDGRMWSNPTSAEICQVIHSFTDELSANGLFPNILGVLRSFSVYKEFSRLENLQVLGDSKHRHDVFMMLKNISEGLAECVMLWSCQSVLNLSEFKLVLDCLLSSANQEPSTKNNGNQNELTFQNNGQLTREGLHLLMSLLHCLQPFSSNTLCADQVSDLTDIDWTHPLYTDRTFAASIGRLLDNQRSLFEQRSEESDSDRLKLLAFIRLSWALCLRRTSHLRAELRRRQTVDVSRSTPYTVANRKDLATLNEDFGIGGDEEDELQAALAIESGALEFARKQILNTTDFEREPLWVYRMHCIITDLIVHMAVRVKEIRLRDEDILRSTGFDPSTTGHGFANFLLLIAQLYNQPGSRLHGRLGLEFWWPVGELTNIAPVALGSSDLLSPSTADKSPRPKFHTYGSQSRNAELDNIRQAALIRFLRLAGDMVTAPCLFLPYLRMLHGLCCSRSAAGLCFSLLKANATNPGRGASLITWDHFFNSFRQYLNHMKQVVVQPEPTNFRLQASNQLYPHLYFNDGVTPRSRVSGFPRSTTESMYGHRKGSSSSDIGATTVPMNIQPRSIQPEEQAGLQAVLRLVARVCRMDPVARSTFISNPQWQLIPICMGFLTCPVSLDLKADILYLLTEFCKSQQNIPVIWQHFVSSETDMDEVEPRAEEYPLTNAFLTLITVMLPKLINYPIPIPSNVLRSGDTKEMGTFGLTSIGHNIPSQTNPFLSITSFITNTIFLRHTMRAYRNPVERVTGLLEVGLHRHLEFPIPNGPPVSMTRATYAGLSLIRRLLASEDILVTFVRRIATNIQPRIGSVHSSSNISIPLPNVPSFGLTILPVYVSRLLMSTNIGSGRADLIPMLLKYCLLADYLPDHTSCAVSILGYLASSIQPHSDLLALLTADETTRNQLLGAFTYLIKWPMNVDINSNLIPMDNNLDNEGHFAFTDEWLYGDNDNNELCLHSVGTFSSRLPSPVINAARYDAAFPLQTNNWYFPSRIWERCASYLNTYFSEWTDMRITHNRMNNNDYYIQAFGDWFYPVMEHPAPNLAHWLCGFCVDNCKAISRSNLQDAGIADQQRTCLHSMLDMIDSTTHWLQSITTLPFEFSCTLQWNLALIWQILYKLGSNPLTSEPLLRFLRGNHDLLAKYLHSDLCQPLLSSSLDGNVCENFTDRQKAVIEALSLNRKNWILRLYAIEIRVCAMANQRSYVTRLLKLFLGAPSVLVNFLQILNTSNELVNDCNPFESKLFNSNVLHELLKKSSINCPLLSSDSNATKVLSTMIHFKIFLMNLFMKLISTRNDLDSYSNEDLNKLITLTFDQVFDINRSAYHLSILEVFNTSYLSSSSSTTTVSALIKQISDLREWIDHRNIHNLHLYAGKQVAIEAWRQAVEISLGLMTNQGQYDSGNNNNTVQRSSNQPMISVPSYLYSELISLLRNDGDGDIGIGSNNMSQYKFKLRPVPVLCLDVLILLLSQICSVKEVPQTIRLLASGTSLTLCSFFHCQSSYVNASKSNISEMPTSGLDKCVYNKHWSPLLISVMELLVKSIVRTKTSTQRMRANYYGSLCYVIRFCRDLGQSLKDDKVSLTDFNSLMECFSIFNYSTTNTNTNLNTIHSNALNSSDLNQLHSTLITDIIHGHTMIQLAAMSLLELLISFDRCSQQLITYLDNQGTIQHILDTIIEDLQVIGKFLTSVNTELPDYSSVLNRSNYLPLESNNNNNHNYPNEDSSSIMSSYLLYQSKMSILCRIGSYPIGAKILANHGIINRLTNCDVLSLSNLANCYSYGLDCLYICEDDNNNNNQQYQDISHRSNESNQLMDLIWFRSSKFQRYLSYSSSSSSSSIVGKSDHSIYWDFIESIISSIMIEPGCEIDENELMKINWAGLLIPTLRLSKILINSLGTTHMSINQQIVNFLHTHSSSLMCNEIQLASSIVTFLSRQDWSYINHSNSSSSSSTNQPINSNWLIQWIASETNLINLFSLIMPSFNSPVSIMCSDEYSNLQREVIQSKILNHTFELLINLIHPSNIHSFTDNDLSSIYKFQNNYFAFEYSFIETQYIQLIYSLLFILTGYISIPEYRIRKFITDNINNHTTARTLFQYFNHSIIHSEQENSTFNVKIQNTLTLIVNLLQWSLKCLRSKEKICLALINVQFLNSSSNSRTKEPTKSKIIGEQRNQQQQQFGQSIVQLLNCESFSENLPINELKQASSIIFKCPLQLLNSVDRITAGKENQNAEIQMMQRLTQLGVSCLRVQLRGLIVNIFIMETFKQSYKQSIIIGENNKETPLHHQSLQSSHGVRNLSTTNCITSPMMKSSLKPLLTPTKRNTLMNTAFSQENNSILQMNMSWLRNHCEHLVQDEIMEMLNQLTKAAYLKQNQRLFIQVMHNRLERIIQKQLNSNLST